MTESTALAIRELSLTKWQVIEAVAPTMHRSRLFGVTSIEAAAAIMIKGHELGMGLGASFEFIQVIQGKPTLSPRGALALIHNSEQFAGMKITDSPDSCSVWMKRKNGFEYSVTWTLEDAKKAGLVTQAGTQKSDGTAREAGNWEKYKSNMLRWRAVGFCADVVFPDVIGGMKRADEFGAEVDTAGNVIDAQWREMAAVPQTEAQPATDAAPWEAPTEQQATVEQPKEPIITLDQLVQEFGAEQVMVAAEGRIPSTDDEVAGVWAKLKLASVA